MKVNNAKNQCESMMRLSSSVSYGAILVDNREVPITREMMSRACKQMDDLQIFPFNGRSVMTDADLKMI